MEERRKNCLLHTEKIAVIEEKVDKILQLLLGNGQIGFCAKVNMLWTASIFMIAAVVGTLVKVFILK